MKKKKHFNSRNYIKKYIMQVVYITKKTINRKVILDLGTALIE